MMEVCERPINEAVHQTLKKGFKEDVLNILQQKINPNCISDNGDTVLHSILRNDKLTETNVVEILIIFLTQRVNPNIENNQEQTVLQLAVDRRMKNAVNCLLQFQADIRAVNRRGNSIAHFFIEDEYEKCKLSMRYPIMNTPVNRDAMENHSVTFLEFLMSKDVDFDFKNGEGQSALHLACAHYLPHILPTLLELTKDIASINEDKKTVLELFLEGKASTQRSHLPDEQQYPNYDSKYTAKILKTLLDRVTNDASKEFICKLISKAIKDKCEISIIEILINYYLNKCNNKNLATTLFHEMLNIWALWSSSETDYFLTVLCDLLAYGVIVSGEPTWHKLVTLAMETKNLRLFEYLKGTGATFSFKLHRGQNLLHMLGEQRDEDSSSDFYSKFCDLLVSGDCVINAADNQGRTPLHVAAGTGHFIMVRKLIELGAEINSRDRKLCTPLHDAASTDNKSVEIVELLLANEADVNAANFNDATPLNFAISNNNVAVVRLLIENGASIDCKNNNQQTLLHRAATIIQAVELVEVLLTCGVDVNTADSKGDTPLHLAVTNINVDIVQSLIENGASVNCKNNYQQTPLHLAATINQAVQIVELLLKYGVDVDAADSKGDTPLHLAVTKINVDTVQSLIENGASVICKNSYQQTPLHLAVTNDKGVDIVDMLISSGAKVNAKDHEGNSPLHLFASDEGLSMVNHIQYAYRERSTSKRMPIIERLLRNGANPNMRNNQGQTALFNALSLENTDLVVELLKYNADMNDSHLRGPILKARDRSQIFQQPIIRFLSEYWMKLAAADLPFPEEYKSFVSYVNAREYRDECSKEVEELKTNFIDGCVSLYDFLHMPPERRCAYVNQRSLQQLIVSPHLKTLLPKYSAIILASYREAMMFAIKEKISTTLTEIFSERFDTPVHNIAKKIFDYLQYEDFCVVVEQLMPTYLYLKIK